MTTNICYVAERKTRAEKSRKSNLISGMVMYSQVSESDKIDVIGNIDMQVRISVMRKYMGNHEVYKEEGTSARKEGRVIMYECATLSMSNQCVNYHWKTMANIYNMQDYLWLFRDLFLLWSILKTGV